MDWVQVAPQDTAPSTGFMSMFSTTSPNSLPSAPAVWMANARIPGSGPSPKAWTKISAKTSSGTVRQNSRTLLADSRTNRLRTRLEADAKHSRKPPIAPVTVPR
jgi:hypothetical protein